jgi:membrane protease YdiL (CAAX protease family)
MKLRLFIFFLTTLLLTLILGFGQEQLKINYELIAIPQIAPGIAFLIMTILFKTLRTRLNIKFDKQIFIRLSLSFFIPIGLIAFGFYMSTLFNLNFELTNNFLTNLPIAIGGMIFGAIGEEIGWRGFLQPTMERQYSTITSAIIVGLFWGLWHIGNYQYGITYMTGFLLFAISASVILRILLDKTENNLLVSVFFHLSINIGFFIFFKNSLTNEKMICLNGFIWALTAFVVSLISKDKISESNGVF